MDTVCSAYPTRATATSPSSPCHNASVVHIETCHQGGQNGPLLKGLLGVLFAFSEDANEYD